MALEKVVYEDNVTVITAAQLNAIQDEIIRVADQITASSFRLRTNGSSRCWANGSQIRWIALAM